MDTFEDVVIGFNAKVQEMLKPMTAVYKSGVVDALSSVGKAYANMNLGITQSEKIKKVRKIGKKERVQEENIMIKVLFICHGRICTHPRKTQ